MNFYRYNLWELEMAIGDVKFQEQGLIELPWALMESLSKIGVLSHLLTSPQPLSPSLLNPPHCPHPLTSHQLLLTVLIPSHFFSIS